MKKAVTLRLDIDDTAYLVDTYLDGNIILDRRVQNFEEVSSQQGTLTRLSFRVSLSESMINAVGDLTDLTQAPLIDIRKSIDGSIIINGQTIYEGGFQIVNVYTNPKEVELRFQGGESALKSRLKKIYLKDLFEGETIGYTAQTIIDYLDGTTNNEDYAYALIDYGQDFVGYGAVGTQINDPNNPLLQTDFKPLVSFKKIVDMLYDVHNVEIELDSSISAEFLNQYIPLHNSENPTPTVDTSPANNTGYYQSTSNRSTTAINTTSGSISIIGDTTQNYNSSAFTTTLYTAAETGVHQFSFAMDLQLNITGTPNYALFVKLKYTTGGVDTEFDRLDYDTGSSITFNTMNTFSINLTAGDTVSIKMDYSQTSASAFSVDYIRLSGLKFACLSTPSFGINSGVLVSENFPEGMNVWDHCIKTIIHQVNGIIEKTETGNKITPWIEWIENGDFLDLNDKIQNGQSVQIQPPSTTGAKKIKFEFEEDSDIYNDAFKKEIGQTYGTLLINDTGIDFAENEIKVSIPYAATPIARVSNTPAVIPKFVDEEGNLVKTKPRLLKFGGYISQPIYIKNTYDTTVYSTDQIPYFGHWETLAGGFTAKDYNFGQSLVFFTAGNYPNNTLYKRFWESYVLETYGIKSRKLTIKTVMSQYTATNLQLNEQVFYKNKYYRILNMTGVDLTNPNSPQTLELALRSEIENIDIAPFYPYDISNTVVQWKDSSDNTDLGNASGEAAADVEESAKAYGYYYDSAGNTAIQSGRILIT